MAYDPEARRQSNSALIIGLVALVLVGGAALAYFATRQPEPGPTTVIQGADRTTTVVVQATPAPGPAVVVTSPPTTVVVPVPAPGTTVVRPGTNTTVTRNTTITRNTRIVQPPASSGGSNSGSTDNGSAAPGSGNSTNVTVNNVVPTTAPAPEGGASTEATAPAPDASANSAATNPAAPGY